MMTPLERALLSLDGLSVGDGFGECFFSVPAELILKRQLPPGPWRWTDDTHMALSIVEVLHAHGEIDQDALAQAFAGRFAREPWRGYGGGAMRLLHAINAGADWRREAPVLFPGGSYGNGAAMRIAPLGGYFAGDLERAAEEARKAAVITHAHPEGQAGAMAVAVAAAVAAQDNFPRQADLLNTVLPYVPAGAVADGLRTAVEIPAGAIERAIDTLGTGSAISAQDTVPFCLWCAAHHLDSYVDALWTTARGLGDVDTTCAIVGGIVALSAGAIPAAWLERREPLPADIQNLS